MTKRAGILHGDLARAIARLGHGQTLVVADCGLPLPRGVEVVDLALVHGIPAFSDVLGAVLGEMEVEASVAAVEARGTEVEEVLARHGLASTFVSHAKLKSMLPTAAVVVRTGEATPFANVALRAGVAF